MKPTHELPLLRLRGGLNLAICAEHALASYGQVLSTAPLVTNVASAAGLAVISDSIVQTATSPPDARWDFERSAWMAVWGGVVSGAIIYYWLIWLGAKFPSARTSTLQLVGKVFVNQLVMSPGLNGGFFAFVIWTRTLPRLLFTAAKRRMLLDKYRQDLLPTIMRSCVFWSVVQAVNFKVVPARYGVLMTNAAFVVWTTYLSFVGNRAAAKKAV